MSTETNLPVARADDRGRRLATAQCSLSARIVQLRLICDSACRGLEKLGHPSVDIQALASFTLDCEIASLEVSRIVQTEFLGGSSVAETAAAPQKESGSDATKLLH